MKLYARILCFWALVLIANASFAQCGAGYTTTSLNWDYLDYFSYTNNYTSPNGYLSSNLLSRTQNFAFGSQRLTIVHNYADANSLGENEAHTGETGSHGNGDGNSVNDMDIQFRGNGVITLTFENEVNNVKFSMFDVDRNQRVSIDARNELNIPQAVVMTALGINVTALTGAPGTASANNTSVANNAVTAAFNVNIVTAVKTITITVTNTGTGSGENGDFWISDIIACTTSNFPSNYYNVSRPYTGQPGYVLHSFDKSVYAVNPANGVTKLLFTDAAGPGNINSMGYDPYNRILYYVYSLTPSAGTNRVLKKYDFNTGTISTVLADISTIGIPTTTVSGVESGAAAFYAGSLYLGIETSNSSRNSNREAVVYRIDFNASNVPYRSSQVFAVPIDEVINGNGTLTHDWSDFVITNGMLYNFDGAGYPATTQMDVYHYNLLTGALPNRYSAPAGFAPGQPTVDWNNNLYQLYASTVAPAINPYIAPYNGNGTIGTRLTLTATPMFTPAIPSLGDAAEGFRPKADFGDAPASYDPVALAPALHEVTANLRIGNAETDEWDKTFSPDADADGADDGLTYSPILNTYIGAYLTNVNVLNNTGANATVAAWIDLNKDGIFQSTEAIDQVQVVPSSATTQTVPLFWSGITQTLPNNSTTFLRIRITSAANGMTKANSTGYFANGEVEDYQLIVNTIPLAINITDFKARKSSDDNVLVNWKVTGAKPNTIYELQRSADGSIWRTIDQKKSGSIQSISYSYTDAYPLQPLSYYRLKYMEPGGPAQYSRTEKISFSTNNAVHIYPNPARSQVYIDLVSYEQAMAVVSVIDISGKEIHLQKVRIDKGSNRVSLQLQQVPEGIYTIRLQTANKIFSEKLFVIKK